MSRQPADQSIITESTRARYERRDSLRAKTEAKVRMAKSRATNPEAVSVLDNAARAQRHARGQSKPRSVPIAQLMANNPANLTSGSPRVGQADNASARGQVEADNRIAAIAGRDLHELNNTERLLYQDEIKALCLDNALMRLRAHQVGMDALIDLCKMPKTIRLGQDEIINPYYDTWIVLKAAVCLVEFGGGKSASDILVSSEQTYSVSFGSDIALQAKPMADLIDLPSGNEEPKNIRQNNDLASMTNCQEAEAKPHTEISN